MKSADNILQSTYRGQDVHVYIDSVTGNGTHFDLNGNFIVGWKFSPEQMNFHITNGKTIP